MTEASPTFITGTGPFSVCIGNDHAVIGIYESHTDALRAQSAVAVMLTARTAEEYDEALAEYITIKQVGIVHAPDGDGHCVIHDDTPLE